MVNRVAEEPLAFLLPGCEHIERINLFYSTFKYVHTCIFKVLRGGLFGLVVLEFFSPSV